DPDRAGAARVLERRQQAGVAGPGVVESGQIGVRTQQGRRLLFGRGIIVEALERTDQRALGEFRGHQRGEAVEPLAVVAEPERSGDEADLAGGTEATEE